MTEVLGRNLQVGDTIETWWRPGRDTITAFRPYEGPWDGPGTRIASFALYTVGMTIPPDMLFKRMNELQS